MFGRAIITLGTGPHSSFTYLLLFAIYSSIFVRFCLFLYTCLLYSQRCVMYNTPGESFLCLVVFLVSPGRWGFGGPAGRSRRFIELPVGRVKSGLSGTSVGCRTLADVERRQQQCDVDDGSDTSPGVITADLGRVVSR